MSSVFGFIGHVISLAWSPSARGRSIRLSVLILLLVGLALASLGFRDININVPGFPEVNRGGAGPLGLKLGLDLRGGGHLVYQADTGTRFDVEFLEPIGGTGTVYDVIFEEPVLVTEIEEAIRDLRFGEEELAIQEPIVVTLSPTDFQIKTALLGEGDPRRTEFQATLEAQLGTIASVNINSILGLQPDQIERVLGELRFGDEELALENFTLNFRSPTSVQIKTILLDEADSRRTEFRETVQASLGEISSLQIDSIDTPTEEQMEGAMDVINRRVNLFGTEEPIIQRFGDDRIIVQLPGASGSITEVRFVDPVPEPADAETLRSVLVNAGYDEIDVERQDDQSFRITSATVGRSKREKAAEALFDELGAIATFRVTSGIDDAKNLIGLTAQLEFKERTCTDLSCTQFTDADLGLTGDDLSRAFARTDNIGIGWVVIIHFKGRGSDIFSDLTGRIFGQQTKRIAFFLDDELLLAPVAQAWIRDGVTRITGNFTREEARTLAIQLEAGRLPVPLRLIQENDVDALLGSESLRTSLIAGIVGLGLVMVFMVAYYRAAGVVASVSLVFYSLVVLAVFKLIPITLTLSHIGGFILSIGMAVDANVLIFERMKEEVRIGRTLASSMEVGFNRAWPAIRDGNFSTLITCAVLLWFGDRLGGGLVTGFAISLGIGVLASMFSAVIVSRNLLQLLAWIGLGHRIGLFTPEGVQPLSAPTAGGGR